MCQVLGFSRQAFYAWNTRPVSSRDLADAYLTDAALAMHGDDPEFGYRFVADELHAASHWVSARRVWRLCSQAQIFSAHSRRRGRKRLLQPQGVPCAEAVVERGHHRHFGSCEPVDRLPVAAARKQVLSWPIHRFGD